MHLVDPDQQNSAGAISACLDFYTRALRKKYRSEGRLSYARGMEAEFEPGFAGAREKAEENPRDNGFWSVNSALAR